MKKIKLGHTKLNVSMLCLGCMNFGTKTDTQTAFLLLDEFVKAGGNFLDTANNYAFWHKDGIGGESESVIGAWMKMRDNRKQIILATKVGAKPNRVGNGFEDAEGLSKIAIELAINESLKRLQTDYIDLLYAHIDDKKTDLVETLSTFHKLITTGKVRAIGCSNYTFERLMEANKICQYEQFEKYCCIQERYSYFQPKENADFGVQEPASKELLEYCRVKKDVTLLAFSPLLHGFYNNPTVLPEKYATKENEARLLVLQQLAQELKVTPNQLVLAWLSQGALPVIPLVATSTLEQLQENLASVTIQLSAEQLAVLSN